MKWTPVLVLGGEGGSIVLEGRQEARGRWFFRFYAKETALSELGTFAGAQVAAKSRASESIKGLDAALEKLRERYPGWAELCPLSVESRFAARICQAALSLCTYAADRWEGVAQDLYFMRDPIASPQQYEKALYGLRSEGVLTGSDLRMLTAQYRARQSTITATELAKAAGFPDRAAANFRYGKLARALAERLGFEPPTGSNGPLYWTALSYSETQPLGEFRLIMRAGTRSCPEIRWHRKAIAKQGTADRRNREGFEPGHADGQQRGHREVTLTGKGAGEAIPTFPD